MAKKPEGISIEGAVALHLQTRTVACTAKQCLQELLAEVRKMVKHKNLTIERLKEALKTWFKEGWAIVNNQSLQVTRAGRKKIKELADAALASPAPVAV